MIIINQLVMKWFHKRKIENKCHVGITDIVIGNGLAMRCFIFSSEPSPLIGAQLTFPYTRLHIR